MNYLNVFILFITLFYIAGCATVGPTIIIETDEPAEDFVVLCKKTKSYLIGHNASGYDVVDNVIVTESGKEVGCGIMLGSSKGNVSILHPVYLIEREKNYTKDGVEHIVMNKTKLDILDEQKAKFEAGYWDKYRWPESRYADSVKGICWFPHQYFDYYREAAPITLEHFKTLYYEPVLQCYRKVVPILKKYDKSYKNMKQAEEYVKGFWVPGKWEQFND